MTTTDQASSLSERVSRSDRGKPRFRHWSGGIILLLLANLAGAFTRDDITLYVPFDGSTEPVVNRSRTAPVIRGSFSFGPGMVGSAVTIGKKGQRLRYPTDGNLDPEHGTFAVWVQSLDWTLDEKVNRWWIDVPGPARFIIYHYLHSNTVFFYYKRATERQPSIIRGRTVWKPGQWKHLAGTWSNGRLRLYIDGRKVPEEARVQPEKTGPWIDVGRPEKGKADTRLDEFYVFRRALTDIEIRALCRRGLRTNRAPAVVRIPHTRTPPVIDGVREKAEYTNAAAVTGFSSTITGQIDPDPAVARLTWDEQNLYVAYEWRVPAVVRQRPDNFSFGPVRAEAAKRDADLSNDDAFILDLYPPDSSRIRIAVNARGVIRDSRNGDPAWNCGVRSASRVDAEQWFCELAVPLRDVGLQPGGKARVRLLRTSRLLVRDTSGWPGPDAPDTAEISLEKNIPAVRFPTVGDLTAGRLDLRTGYSGKDPVDILVTDDAGSLHIRRRLTPDVTSVALQAALAAGRATALRIEAHHRKRLLLGWSIPFCVPPLFDVDLYFFPSSERAVLHATAGAGALQNSRFRAVLRQAGNPEVLVLRRGTARPAPATGECSVELSTAGLPPGEYEVEGVLLDASGTPVGPARRTRLEIRTRPEWLGNRLGIIDFVPKPWTPLEYAGRQVRCWGRTVDLGDGLFPARIESQGKPLLAGPVRLVAELADREAHADAATFTWTKRTPQVGTWKTTGRIGPLRIEVRGRIEFDGMLWFRTRLRAAPPATVRSLRIEVPVDRPRATLFYSGDYRTRDTGRTPRKRWACGFRPCLGLSDEDRGLQWFAESTRGWHLTRRERALELIPTGKSVVLVMHVIDAPTEIRDAPREFAFGLHPTPVKPLMPGRRNLRPFGKPDMRPRPNIRLWFTNYGLGCSYPLPVRAQARRFIEQQHARGIRVLAYTRLCECSVKGPWYAYFRDEWRVHPGPRMDPNPEADWGDANPVCPGSASWRDWTVWSVYQACRQLGFDGLYYDVSRPPFCANAAHGCGFRDDTGARRPEYALLATRELQKRLWILMHVQLGGKLVSHHMSGHLYTVTQSFDDMIIDGENFTSMLEDNYYHLLPLDKFRAEFMGRQWGLVSIFLPEFSRARLDPEAKKLWESPAKIPEVRHLAGMIFLHDAIPWPSYSDLTPYATIWAAQDALGWGDDVEFLPYWRNDDLVGPLPENVVVSIYRRNGRALLVLFNNTDRDQDVTLRLDQARLGAQVRVLRDFENNEIFRIEHGRARIPIRHRDFRLLLTW